MPEAWKRRGCTEKKEKNLMILNFRIPCLSTCSCVTSINPPLDSLLALPTVCLSRFPRFTLLFAQTNLLSAFFSPTLVCIFSPWVWLTIFLKSIQSPLCLLKVCSRVPVRKIWMLWDIIGSLGPDAYLGSLHSFLDQQIPLFGGLPPFFLSSRAPFPPFILQSLVHWILVVVITL